MLVRTKPRAISSKRPSEFLGRGFTCLDKQIAIWQCGFTSAQPIKGGAMPLDWLHTRGYPQGP